MMRKTITRTMCTSTITAYKVTVVNGEPKVETVEPLTIAGKAKEKDALKALRDVHGKDANLTVGKIEVSEDIYEISVDDFVKYATKVTPSQKVEPKKDAVEAPKADAGVKIPNPINKNTAKVGK